MSILRDVTFRCIKQLSEGPLKYGRDVPFELDAVTNSRKDGKRDVINEDIRHIVEAELREGEELLWADKSRKLSFSVMEKSIIGFLVFWLACCFLIVLPITLLGDEPYKVTVNGVEKFVGLWEYLMFLSIFPAFALLMFAWVLGFAYLRTGHFYAITDKRVFIISKLFGKRVASFHPDKLGKIQRYKTKTDFGSINFFSETHKKFDALMKPFELQTLSGIKNLREVESLILSLQDKGTTP